MIEKFRKDHPEIDVEIFHAFFEEFDTDEKFDVIGMGFVLEHVEDPAAVLRRYARFLAPGGSIFIAVPNAESLHRRFGAAAGLLPDMTALSAADIEFGHRRYFTLNSLRELVTGCGLAVGQVEGLFLKPVTTAQLHQLNLGPELLQGMLQVGVAYPELCNSILMQATRPPAGIP
jgi:2-polyprenyl-3-methyl-5-hydroxy-6-metoxy-1,4-benzoquinol methylase